MTAKKLFCMKLGIPGGGEADFMTTYDLRATIISLLIFAVHLDAAIVLRTGHRDRNSLQSYHNLHVIDLEKHLGALFGGSE